LHDNLRLHIVYRASDGLLPPKRILKKYSKRQVQLLKASVSRFGVVRPILIDAEQRIVAGHGIWLAAKELGVAAVPVIVADHLSKEELRVYALLDNKSAELSEWDDELLRLELGDLVNLDLGGDLDINLDLTGFTTSEIDGRLDVSIGTDAEAEEDIPELEATAVTKVGSLWIMGNHKLVCGNALEGDSYQRLLGSERAQMIFSDAPYNVPIDRYVSGHGKIKHREFQMAAGEMTEPQFTGFLHTAFDLAVHHSINGSIHFQCMDWHHMGEMLAAGRASYSELKNLVIWYKIGTAGLGSFYRSQHELLFVWKNGTQPHINNFGLGETGRFRSNVWSLPGLGGFGKGRDKALADHPTQKPVSLVADAIRDCSRRGGIILDPFGGSGTTLIAAEKTGRRARLIELDPLYCDVTVRRWQQHSGKAAIDAATGQTFDALAQAGHAVSEEEA